MFDNLPLLGIGQVNVNLPKSKKEVVVQVGKRIWTWVSNANNAAQAYSNAPGPDASDFALADWVATYLTPRINSRFRPPPGSTKEATQAEQLGDDQGGTLMPPMWRHDP